ncbi:MAG: YeeE/YedE family protein [Ideonella sp.]
MQGATQLVIWGALLIGLLFGALGQWSRFCVRGAIADWVLERKPGRLASWMLAVLVAAIGTQLLIAQGLFDASKSVAWTDRFVWASYLVGGAVFGYGMILARGCPQRSLVKAGAGDMRAIVTLLVVSISAQMTLRGLFAKPRTQLLDSSAVQLAGPQDLGSLLGGATDFGASATRWLILAVLAAALITWLLRARRNTSARQWIGGLLIGLLVPAAWYLSGHLGFIAEHPDTLEATWLGTQSHRPEGLSFIAPLAASLDLLTLWTDQNTIVTFGVMLSLGVLLGSLSSALLRRDFRVESFESPRQLVEHLVGGVLMGFGGVTALGCSIGQGLTGLAMLSAGAFLAVAGIVFGAWSALRIQTRNSAHRARIHIPVVA